MINRSLLASLWIAPAALGQVNLGLLAPWPQDARVQPAAQGAWQFDSETDNDDADFQLSIYEAYGRARLGPGTIEEGSPAVGFRVKYLDLDSDDPALPPRLVDQAIGVGTGLGERELLGRTWRLGATLGVGYAGNNPFADFDAVYVVANLLARTDLNDKTELRVGLNFDGNRAIFPDLPLPTVVLTRRESERFSWNVGFPFLGFIWKPDDKLTIRGRYLFPDDGELLAEYALSDHWTLFGGYDSTIDAFRIDGDDHDRLFFRQRRVEAGVRWSPLADERRASLALELAGGYAFDQRFETGWDVRDLDDVAEVDAAPFVRASLMVLF